MPNPDPKKEIKKIYDEGMAEVFKVIGSYDVTTQQLKIARQTAKDLASMLVAHTLQTIEGRTALLASLIVELNQIINSIQVNPPYKQAMDNFTNIATRAQKLFDKEKKSLP